MSMMQAAVFRGDGRVEVERRPVPEPGPREVLVEIAAVGVCGSDVHYYEHGRIGPYVVDHPLILGHELSGRIAAATSAGVVPGATSRTEPSGRAILNISDMANAIARMAATARLTAIGAQRLSMTLDRTSATL